MRRWAATRPTATGRWSPRENGKHATEYYVRGHFIHTLSGRERLVSRGAWIYSYVHSISVPLTSGAMIISMLVLARPHILATMRGGLVGGQTFVVAFGTIVSLVAPGGHGHVHLELRRGPLQPVTVD